MQPELLSKIQTREIIASGQAETMASLLIATGVLALHGRRAELWVISSKQCTVSLHLQIRKIERKHPSLSCTEPWQQASRSCR